MANEIEKLNAITLANIAKFNAKTDANIEKINGLEFTGVTLFKGIFGFGTNSSDATVGVTNLVSNVGVVATDTSAVGTARTAGAAAEYGTGTAIFGFGQTDTSGDSKTGITNLVNTSGVVASDVSAVGTARQDLAAAGYGSDKAIFGFGKTGDWPNEDPSGVTNLVNNSGVVQSDTSAVGTARLQLQAETYDDDKAIFFYGYAEWPSLLDTKNLVNNSGVVASDASTTGSSRRWAGTAGYGTGTAIVAFGAISTGNFDKSNLINTSGVISSDITGVGTTRNGVAGCQYGEDKGIMGFGRNGSFYSTSNLVSNAGVVATDTTGVGTARSQLMAASYGT